MRQINGCLTDIKEICYLSRIKCKSFSKKIILPGRKIGNDSFADLSTKVLLPLLQLLKNHTFLVEMMDKSLFCFNLRAKTLLVP